MILIFWGAVFIASLVALIKGADWLLLGAERIGLRLGFPPFIIGVTIVGIGTGLPELTAGIVAVVSDVGELPVANAAGSNIANILLVIGILALWSRRVEVKKSLIDLDIPLLVVATLLFAFIVFDQQITLVEILLLLVAYGIYLGYTITEREESEEAEVAESLPEEVVQSPRWWEFWKIQERSYPPDIRPVDWVRLGVGVIALAVGAQYVIDSVIELSATLGIGAGLIALIAVAFGTSLPEVIVSLKAANRGKPEVALGNIIGSSVFNLLMVVGGAGLFGTLVIDSATFSTGLPFLLATTFLFTVSGISRRIYVWEGVMYLLLYGLFIGKVTGML
jgi:cation:H+ antiporter